MNNLIFKLVKINPKPFTKLNLVIGVISTLLTKEFNIERSKHN